MVSRTKHDPESPPSMPALSLKRSAALREEEGARKRHASTDHVLGDNESLTRYLSRNQESLTDLQHKHNTLESDHNELLKAFIEFRNEVGRDPTFEKETYSKTRKALVQRNAENDGLMKDNARLSSIAQDAQRHMASAIRTADSYKDSNKNMCAELEMHQASADRRVAMVAAEYEQRIGLLESSKADLQARLNMQGQSNGDDLRQQVVSATAATKAAEEKAWALQQKVDELERSKRNSDSRARDQATLIGTLEVTKARLEAESNKVSTGNTAQDQMKVENDLLKQEKADLEKRVLELNQEGEKLNGEMAAAEKQVAELTEGNDTLLKENTAMNAEIESLKRSSWDYQTQAFAEAQKRAEAESAMDITPGPQSDTTSACDFIGIDLPSGNKSFASGCPLGAQVLPSLQNAIDEKQASVLPQDVSKSMLAVGFNHAIAVITPRFIAPEDDNDNVEPITLVCEVQPKNFEYLSQHLLLPYRDPNNPHVEPDDDFAARYAQMCLLAQHPEVWIEAATDGRLYNGPHWNGNTNTLIDKVYRAFGCTYQSNKRADMGADALRKMYEPMWRETVWRLANCPAFKGALFQWAMGKDVNGLFDRWLPHVLKGIPRAELIYECPPAAPITENHDGIDTEIPDANTGVPTGLEVIDAIADTHARQERRNQRNNEQREPAPRVRNNHNEAPRAPTPQVAARPVVNYDADGENPDDAFDFEGILQTGRRAPRQTRRRNENAIAEQNANRGVRRPRNPTPRVDNIDNYNYPLIERTLNDHRRNIGAQPVRPVYQAANEFARAVARHTPQTGNNGDHYAAQRAVNNQQRQNQQNGANAPRGPRPQHRQNQQATAGNYAVVPVGPRAQQGENIRGNASRGRGRGRGRGANNQGDNDMNRAAQFGLGAENNANDAIQAFMAGRAAGAQRGGAVARGRGNNRGNNRGGGAIGRLRRAASNAGSVAGSIT